MQRPASHVAMASGKILYSVTTVAFGFICFIVGAIAVGLPAWGYFHSFDNPNFDQGYFGPWRVCKRLLYNREKCGSEVSKFRPIAAVYIAGVVGAIGVAVLGVFCVLSIVQLAMISSKDRVCLKYTSLVMLKMALALLATLLSVVAAAMFAAQTDDRGFYLQRGEGFYVQIVCIVINALLFIMSIYDVLFSRRPGGDPTDAVVADSPDRISRHPAFKDPRGISMTDASGKPYSTNGHGSTASMNTTNTTLTNLSDASTITRSPLRSSLKKPRPKDDPSQGIHNPGYSGSSPNLNRNGSQKKVRINTHSTEV